MTPSVDWRAVLLNGLKFLVVMSPAATVMEASLAAGWPPLAAPEQAPSRSAVAVTAAALTRRRVLVRFVGFRSIDRFLSGPWPAPTRSSERVTRHPAREAGRNLVGLINSAQGVVYVTIQQRSVEGTGRVRA